MGSKWSGHPAAPSGARFHRVAVQGVARVGPKHHTARSARAALRLLVSGEALSLH